VAYFMVVPNNSPEGLSITTKTLMRITSMWIENQIRLPEHERPNSEALVRQRTIPTERSPLVGEVNANFSR
jgi:hypothetical protein